MSKRVKTTYDRGYVNAMNKIRLFSSRTRPVYPLFYYKGDLKMYIIIGLGLICATIGFVVGSAVRWKIDYEAETIGSLIVAQADENENPSLFLNLGGESVDFADKQYVILKVSKVSKLKPREKHSV